MVSRRKDGRFIQKGHGKQVFGLKKGLNVRIAKSKCFPLPPNIAHCETVDETIAIDHNYLGVQEEVTLADHNTGLDDTCDCSYDWRTGRRIVELGSLADGLRSCQLCQLPLHLYNCVGERKFGLSQILLIRCESCELINDVPTGSRHRTEKGGLAWDANTKLAAGMINGGLGETHVNSLLAVLNIPGICQKNLKGREREVGQQLEKMADESCSRNLANELNKNCSLSPGTYTMRHMKRMDSRLKLKRLRVSEPNVKRRRLDLKAERQSKNASQSVLEGDTYQSNICIEEDPVDIADIDLNAQTENLQNHPLVFFDLETGGLGQTSDILQIAAKSKEKEFNIYTLPVHTISKEASTATSLTFDGSNLCYKGKAVPAVSPLQALENFIAFIKSFDQPILVGHNIQNIDLPILRHHLTIHSLIECFSQLVTGFLDTLKISKVLLRNLKLTSYKQENLVHTLLGEDYEAHNAMADVASLERLYYDKLCVSESEMCEHIFYLSYFTCKESLEPLLRNKIVSSLIVRKLVRFGLSMSQLRHIHRRDQENGIRFVFAEPLNENSKGARITKSVKIIQKVVDYLNA